MWPLSTHRYDNKGCARSYLSQRDLEAHAVYRHAATVTSSSTSSTVAVPVAASVVTTASNTIPFSYSFLSAMPRPPELALSAHVRLSGTGDGMVWLIEYGQLKSCLGNAFSI